jgi:uracil-DNA glycosylase
MALTFDPGAPPSATFDKGPPAALAHHFAAVPGYQSETVDNRGLFWWDWGPVFYRGRLNKTAKVVGIASDPGPTERLVGRTLVGDAGQRVQGLMTKLGLTHSYVLVNAFAYAVHPSKVSKALPLLADPDQATWRNHFYDLVSGPEVQAVIAFGGNAQAALAQWTSAPDVPTFKIPHPSDHSTSDLVTKWNAALPAMRTAVTPDEGGDNTGPAFGSGFPDSDYAPIPAADLPFGLPTWIGNDSWGRTGHPRHNNCVDRSSDDADHAMIWQAPVSVS